MPGQAGLHPSLGAAVSRAAASGDESDRREWYGPKQRPRQWQIEGGHQISAVAAEKRRENTCKQKGG